MFLKMLKHVEELKKIAKNTPNDGEAKERIKAYLRQEKKKITKEQREEME